MKNYKEKFMKMALKEAQKAYDNGEVPIGAVLVLEGKVIAKGRNKCNELNNAVAHAEVVAINKASKKLKDWRLENVEMYVTLEPCAMCAGAIANSRIKKVHFGAYERKSGAVLSNFHVLFSTGLNHQVDVEGGILEEQCSMLLKKFFKNKREEN